MKKLLLPLSLLFAILIITMSFMTPANDNSVQVGSNVRLKFITYNQYGNNLYVDNVTVGEPFLTDIAVLSINNIARDIAGDIDKTKGHLE